MLTILPPAIHKTNQQEWSKTLANIAKPANIQARKITTQCTQNCIKKAISNYRKITKNVQKIKIKMSSKLYIHLH